MIVATTVFGMPILLKRKADKVPVDVAPLPSQPSPPHQPSLPPPTAKHPRRDQELVVRCGLLRTGAQRIDILRVAQMAAQEASGVMAAAMLRQQGAMRKVSVWESEVEGTMREMSKLVDEAESDL